VPSTLRVWKILLVYGSEPEFQSRNQSNLNDPDPCINVATQFVDLSQNAQREHRHLNIEGIKGK